MRSREASATTPVEGAGVAPPGDRHGADLRTTDMGQGTLAFVVSLGLGGAFVASLVVAFVFVVSTDSNGGEHAEPAWAASFADWLALDASVAPPFEPEDAEHGGIEVGQSELLAPANDRCGARGTNLLHVRWHEPGGASSAEVVANYRFVVVDDRASIIRVTCERTGTAPFVGSGPIEVAAGLDPATPPTLELDRDLVTGRIETVQIDMATADGGEVIVIGDARDSIGLGTP